MGCKQSRNRIKPDIEILSEGVNLSSSPPVVEVISKPVATTDTKVQHSVDVKGYEKDSSGLMFRDIKYDSKNLLAACKRGNIDTVREALSQGADVNIVGMWSCTPLILSLQYGYDDIAKLLLAQNNIDINHVNEKGATALLYACIDNKPIIVQRLISLKANINPTPSKPIQITQIETTLICTPLSIACVLGHTEVVKVLLDSGCPVDQSFPFNLTKTARTPTSKEAPAPTTTNSAHTDTLPINATPLMIACAYAKFDAIQRLIDFKPNMAGIDSESSSALHHLIHAALVRSNDIMYICQIFQYFYDKHMLTPQYTSIHDCNGDTILHLICHHKLYDILILLIKCGIDLNTPNSIHGYTALHIAVNKRDTRMVSLLLKAHADVAVRDEHSETPVTLAKRLYGMCV